MALRIRKLPAAASAAYINLSLASDLELIRAVARDSMTLDLGFDLDAFREDLLDDHNKNQAIHALVSRSANIDLLEERLQVPLANPLIRKIGLRHRFDSRGNSMVISTHDHSESGWAPFQARPSLGNPVVARLLGTKAPAVQYAEVVAVDEQGADVLFELVLDLNLLEAHFADQNHSELR